MKMNLKRHAAAASPERGGRTQMKMTMTMKMSLERHAAAVSPERGGRARRGP